MKHLHFRKRDAVLFGVVLLLSGHYAQAEVSGAVDISAGYRMTDTEEMPLRMTNTVGATGELGGRFTYGFELSTTLADDALNETDGFLPDPAIQLVGIRNAYVTGPFFGSENIDPDALNMTIGRFPVSDAAGVVVSTPADGVQLTLVYPRFRYSLSLGYTGLLWRDDSSILMSNTDLDASGRSNVYLGSPRLIGILGIRLPRIYDQQIAVNVIFQEDMWSSGNVDFVSERSREFQPGAGGPLDTQYIGVAINGPVPVDNLFQSSFVFLNGGRMLSFVDIADPNADGIYRYRAITAWAFGTSLRYYRPAWNYSSFALRVIVSSGDDDFSSYYEGNTKGKARQFVPITPISFGAIFSPKLGNVAVTEIQYSQKPLSTSSSWMLSSIQTQARGFVFFRTTDGPVSEPGIAAGDGGNLLGSELDFTVNMIPFPDLALSSTVGFFFPAAADGMGAFTEAYVADRSVQTSVSVQASLAY